MLERRKYKRFKGEQGTFVFSAGLPGIMNNISMGGMAFSHVLEGEESQEVGYLSVLDKTHDFFMENIACRTVESRLEENGPSFSIMRTVRKNVEFILSPDQEVRLKKYLDNYDA